ncbi:MAG: SpoIIE family protein phosphatase [Rhodothermaceae bacterium]
MFGSFIEVDYSQKFKNKHLVAGDTFLSRKLKEEERTIAVLSDGLGSGIKANVLSTLTATMALNYVNNNFDLHKAAKIIMQTLPVCKVRKISYSTFSIVDINKLGEVTIMEYDNPPYVIIRDGEVLETEKEIIQWTNKNNYQNTLRFSKFTAQKNDRIIMFSDGVTQSGLGPKTYPFGWQQKNVEEFISAMICKFPEISARMLAKSIVDRAYINDRKSAYDDITCSVINIREPRKLVVMTGPPIDKRKDRSLAETIDAFDGKKIICGGTTAKIISRELGREITVNLKDLNPEVPTTSNMPGIDLITEGSITLGKVVELLQNDKRNDKLPANGATRMLNFLLDSDIIEFVVGTKINDAHQDPNVPVELEIRRNIIKQICELLEKKYLKETKLSFI